MNLKIIGASGLGLAALCMAQDARAETIIVYATDCPWLAGMPDGSAGGDGNDQAPEESPAQVTSPVMGGTIFTFSATGSLSNVPFPKSVGPDGAHEFFSRDNGAENGIADIRCPLNALIGVFLDDSRPDLTAAPDALNFQTIGLDFQSLSPGLKQPFFIGNGRTSNGDIQQFIAPEGATRLFLGSMDGTEWNNNFGSATVHIPSMVPEPSTLLILGLGAFAFGKRRRSVP